MTGDEKAEIVRNVISEFILTGKTVNAIYYRKLFRLRRSVRKNRSHKWREGWWLHYDNAPSHTVLLIQEFLPKNQLPILPQSPYSTDFTLCDFWLFTKMKSILMEKKFENSNEYEGSLMKHS